MCNWSGVEKCGKGKVRVILDVLIPLLRSALYGILLHCLQLQSTLLNSVTTFIVVSQYSQN